MSGIVLWAEVKMGRLLKRLPRTKLGVKKRLGSTSGTYLESELQKTGVSMRERSRAQILGRNKDAIEEVI